MRQPWILTVAEHDGALDEALAAAPGARLVRSIAGRRAVVLATPAEAARLGGLPQVRQIVPDRLEHPLGRGSAYPP